MFLSFENIYNYLLLKIKCIMLILNTSNNNNLTISYCGYCAIKIVYSQDRKILMLKTIKKYIKQRIEWKFNILRKYWWAILLLFIAMQIWLRHIVLLRNTLGPVGQ